MKQQRRYKEPQDTLWGKFLSGFMAVVFAMSTLTLIPIASAINGEPNEAQIQQQEELADQTSGKDEKAAEPAADEQKLEPVELLSIASVEDEDDADDAAPADVTLKVKAQNATVTYNGNDVATELVVPADKDVKFTVKAADGFTLGAAAVKLSDAKGETTLTPNAGEYTVAADRVADGATVVVTAEAVAGSANTGAAEPSTPAPSTELGEKMEMAKSVVTSIIDSVFGGTSTLAITGENTVAVGETIQLSGSSNGRLSCKYSQTWTSDDGNVATVNSSGKVTGIKAGKVTITHTYCNAEWFESCHHNGNGNSTIKSETFTLTVTDPSYNLYLYALIPGKDADQTGQADSNWFGLGVVTVKGVPDPAIQSEGYVPASYEIDYTNVIKGPIYPDLTYGGVTYKYAASGTDNSYKEGYYTLEPMRLRVAKGANAGSNEHNLTASGNTYHYDYTVVLNEKDIYTVNFKVQDPGYNTFAAVESAAQRVSSGTNESALTQPEMEDSKIVDGVIYQFNGWYTDEACTQKADFNGAITANTNYYGKYVPVNLTYTINYVDEQGNAIDTAKVVNDAVFGTVVTASSEAKDIDGYTYKSADRESITVGTDAEANVITLTYAKRADLTYTINYVDEQGNAIDTAKVVNDAVFGTVVTASSEAKDIDGYTYKSADRESITVGTDAEANVITLTYANAILSYTVEYYYDDTLGETDTAPAVFNSPVTVNPATSTTRNDVNYTLVNVTPADGITIGVDETANVIRVYYEKDTITDPNNDGNGENPGDGIPDKYQAVVNYESANDAQGTVNLAQKVITFANNATSGTVNIFDGVVTNPTAGSVFDGWTEGGNAVASNLTRVLQGNTEYTFIANWALDVIGTDPIDPGNNAPDGIADKYQLVVTYAAIAGTIDGPARYVLNKYDAAGNLAEDGVAVLTAAQIPGATADDGYGNGVWNNEPLANMELTDDTAFVIAFTALPAAAVVVPPLAPVAAAAPAAAAAAAATILDDGVPLATIDDDENALAAFEEIHCWTHWLMIFGALVTIVYGLAVLYRRRHGIRDMDDFEGDITGGRKYDAAAERNPAAGNAFQAM